MVAENRFLLFCFSTCFTALLVIALFNFYSNPGGLFTETFHATVSPEMKFAKILASGKNVATAYGVDERPLRMQQIAISSPGKGALVLGSSRVMEIRKGVAQKELESVSSWVGGASLDDMMGLYQLHQDRGAHFQKVLLGIDPWCFNAEGKADPRAQLLEPHSRRLETQFARKISASPQRPVSESKAPPSETWNHFFNRYLQLITWGYTAASLHAIEYKNEAKKLTWGPASYLVTTDDWNDDRTFRPDGSTGYDRKYRENPPGKVESLALEYGASTPYKLDHFTRVDEARWQQLISFLDYLQAQNIQVDIFLPPYHPTTAKLIQTQSIGPLIQNLEKKIRETAASRNIKVWGSYNPGQTGVSSEDFYDGMHLKRTGIDKVFSIAPPPN